MSPRAFLLCELDAWSEAGGHARFWWRDDDLGEPTPQLDPLLRVAANLEIEPMLAVVPRWASPNLPKILQGFPARVAVHGWAHVDHQQGAGKKTEFGDARPVEILAEEARAGRERLVDLFGDDLLACFVPPWNRMVADLAKALPAVGYHAVSVFGSRPATEAVPGLNWVNTHVDVIDWRGNRRFIGSDTLAETVTRELHRRRTASDENREPIGLLTHHLEMDPDDWEDFRGVCDILVTHPAARMLSSSALFRKCGAYE